MKKGVFANLKYTFLLLHAVHHCSSLILFVENRENFSIFTFLFFMKKIIRTMENMNIGSMA